jgi:hypothetical protein
MLPRITALIPTRDRADVLEHCLRAARRSNYADFHIIVCDNASSDSTRDVVQSIRDERITYINPGVRLAMSANWEYGLSHVEDGWVTILGDDDALLPRALERVADIVSSTDLKAVRANGCSFLWPPPGSPHGLLVRTLRTEVEIRDCRTWLAHVLEGRAPYTELPVLYNGGFVHMSALRELQARTGSIYKSLNPDVYSGVALCQVLSRYAYSHDALAINGRSRHSGGSAYFSSRLGDALPDPAAAFYSEANIPFHPALLANQKLPPRCLHLMTVECYLQSSVLRSTTNLSIDYLKHVRIALAAATVHRPEIVRWATAMASVHGFRLDARTGLAVALLRWVYAIRRLRSCWSSLLTQRFEGSATQPLTNIDDAYRFAETLDQRHRPNLLLAVAVRLTGVALRSLARVCGHKVT